MKPTHPKAPACGIISQCIQYQRQTCGWTFGSPCQASSTRHVLEVMPRGRTSCGIACYGRTSSGTAQLDFICRKRSFSCHSKTVDDTRSDPDGASWTSVTGNARRSAGGAVPRKHPWHLWNRVLWCRLGAFLETVAALLQGRDRRHPGVSVVDQEEGLDFVHQKRCFRSDRTDVL